jgi:hypothetical protein
MTTTAGHAPTAMPGRRAALWIPIVNACTAAVVLWFYGLPGGAWSAVPYGLPLVLSAATVWALAGNRPRLARPLLAATVILALPALASWIAVLAFIALAILSRSARAGGAAAGQAAAERGESARRRR